MTVIRTLKQDRKTERGDTLYREGRHRMGGKCREGETRAGTDEDRQRERQTTSDTAVM